MPGSRHRPADVPRPSRGVLERVRTLATAAFIADQIRGAIVTGSYAPGSQLVEATLSEELGVSRGPVREAFQRLTQEGLLINRRNRGVFVVQLSEEDIRDIYFSRGVVETAAAERLVAVPRDEATASLAKIVAAMEKESSQRDWKTVAELDVRFHETLVHSADSQRLDRMFATLLSETQISLHALGSAYDNYSPIAREHSAILDAIRQRDAHGTVILLAEHMRDSCELLVRSLREASEEP